MNALERHISEINLLYEELNNTTNSCRKQWCRKRIEELEAELLEYCSWRNLDYNTIYKKIVK